MKVINLNSKFELTQAQISFAESVIIFGEHEKMTHYDSLSVLMNEIPIFLVNEKTQKEINNEDFLGFYQHSTHILGAEISVIGLCLERIIKQVNNDEELIILIAKVLIHEFAHAKMKLHSNAIYAPIDEFYKWMEEPIANLITLEYFKNYEYYTKNNSKEFAFATTLVSPFDYVKFFISQQPDNYRLGLDLFEHKLFRSQLWPYRKNEIQKKTIEKQKWLDYVKANVGNTDKAILDKLFEDLCE